MADTPPNLLIPALTAAAGFFGGLVTQWLTRWSADWFTRREIRAAIKAEIAPIVVTLNFYILKAIEAAPNERRIAAQYFGAEMRFGAFDYYWSEKRDQLLKIPEWSRLQNWYSSLRTITHGDEPVLFKAIMSFEGLLIPPLTFCVNRTTRGVIRQTLERLDVGRFKTDYMLAASGLKTSTPGGESDKLVLVKKGKIKLLNDDTWRDMEYSVDPDNSHVIWVNRQASIYAYGADVEVQLDDAKRYAAFGGQDYRITITGSVGS